MKMLQLKLRHLKEDRFILLILFLFLLIQVSAFLKSNDMWWDSAVYIGMGKYMFSLGKIGLWETPRPLVWPLLLGLLWKLNLSPTIYGRILELLFASGCVYLAYKTGKEIFNEKIGLLSALLLAFTPTFLFFSKIMLSDIPSAFFALLAVYLFIKKEFFYTGLFASIAFMTRFLQIGIFISILIILVYNHKKYKNFNKNLLNLVSGFSIILAPFLIFNTIRYGNPVHPFLFQLFMAKYTGWVFHQPFSFYFVSIVKENFMFLFSLIGIFFIFKKRNITSSFVLAILLLFFIFFNLISHKEMRFVITFLPYLAMISSYGLFSFIDNFKKKNKPIILAALLILLSLQLMPQLKPEKEENQFIDFQDYMAKDGVKENIWITSPVYAVYSNKKIDELVYFPTFNNKRIDELSSKLEEAEHILFNSCDLYCEPYFKDCEEKKADFIGLLKTKFKTVFYEKKGECGNYIFTK